MSGRDELGGRGKALWDSYGADALPAGQRALIQEAARLADTLDQMARLAAGDVSVWAELASDEMGNITLVINGLIAERRQQQLAFTRLLGEIRQAGIKPKDETANDERTTNPVLRLIEGHAAG